MNTTLPPFQVTINGHPLPLFHAQVVQAAMQQFYDNMSKRNACGESESAEDMRAKYVTASQQINALFI